MLGNVKVDKLDAIVQPLRALNSVLSDNNTKLHVVYEFEDDLVFIGAKDGAGTAFGMYELDINEVSEGYSNPNTEVGITYVPEFISRLSLFDKDFSMTLDELKRINISNDTDSALIYTSDVGQIPRGKRKLKTELLDKLSTLRLGTTDVSKLKQAISSYSVQDIVNFEGNAEDNTVVVTIASNSDSNSDKFSTTITDAEVQEDFEMRLSKDQFSKVIGTNSTFEVTHFGGKKRIVEFAYATDEYRMKFYLSPAISV